VKQNSLFRCFLREAVSPRSVLTSLIGFAGLAIVYCALPGYFYEGSGTGWWIAWITAYLGLFALFFAYHVLLKRDVQPLDLAFTLGFAALLLCLFLVKLGEQWPMSMEVCQRRGGMGVNDGSCPLAFHNIGHIHGQNDKGSWHCCKRRIPRRSAAAI
jgi:hypothetical protein